jgi:hypothetical protein
MKRHATDSVSLFFGLAFLGIAVAFLFFQGTDAQVPDVRWFLAAGLVLLGLMGIFGALRPRRHADPADADDPEQVEPGSPADLDDAETGNIPVVTDTGK